MRREATRRDALRRGLATDGIDALLVTSLVNVRYLTGFTGSAGRVLVAADPDRDVFVTDDRYELHAGTEVGDMAMETTRDDDWLVAAVAGMERVGLEADQIAWGAANRLISLIAERLPADRAPALEASSGRVEELRQVKDHEELAMLERAAAIADRAIEELFAHMRPDWSERQAAVHLERVMVDLGADAPAFPTIVAAGEAGAQPHHRAGPAPLGTGQLVTIDFGARVDGYHSDCTRVCAFGEPAAAQRALFDVVHEAQGQGVAALADGVSGVEADEACRAVIRGAGYADRFPHGTGHGIGLDVHEAPSLGPRSDSTLSTAMVVTVEPGIYIPGVGGARVEDTVAIEPEQARVLTSTSTPLVVL